MDQKNPLTDKHRNFKSPLNCGGSFGQVLWHKSLAASTASEHNQRVAKRRRSKNRCTAVAEGTRVNHRTQTSLLCLRVASTSEHNQRAQPAKRERLNFKHFIQRGNRKRNFFSITSRLQFNLLDTYTGLDVSYQVISYKP